MVVEPLELEMMGALKRADDSAVIIDMIIEKRSFESFVVEHKPDVLCVTGYITNVSTIISYCEAAKRISDKIITIVGGVHCEVCPEDFFNEAVDFRVVRNAARVFTGLLDYIEFNKELPEGIMRNNDLPENVKLPAFDFRMPFPDRELVSRYRDKYFYIFHDKVALIKTSFGCPYSCSFCFCRVITNGQFYQRPVSEIMQELEQIKEKEIYIVDDDFLVDKKRLQEFINKLKIRKIEKHFLVYGRADFIAKNPDIMHEFALIGLRTVIVGFESFSDDELDLYNKHTNVDMYKDTMKVLYNENIDCFATIIIPPHWDKSNFRKMVSAIKSLGIHFVNLQPLTPLPKTEISFPKSQIIIKRTDYDKWDLAHISVQPSKLTVPEFYSEILKAYNAVLYSPDVLWKYIKSYKPLMLFKMLVGGYRVTKQYKRKIKEANKIATKTQRH